MKRHSTPEETSTHAAMTSAPTMLDTSCACIHRDVESGVLQHDLAKSNITISFPVVELVS
eukprot:202776-Pyramimonas_sp.AAC.1